VSASISTPVLPIVSTWARQCTLAFGSSISKPTVTRVIGSGWHSGTRSLVRLAPMMAAMRAMPSTSPFFAVPDTISASVALCMRMVPAATATRWVSALAPTSTIWAWPLASKWVSCSLMRAVVTKCFGEGGAGAGAADAVMIAP